jgi:hypothetical protein
MLGILAALTARSSFAKRLLSWYSARSNLMAFAVAKRTYSTHQHKRESINHGSQIRTADVLWHQWEAPHAANHYRTRLGAVPAQPYKNSECCGKFGWHQSGLPEVC